MKSRQKVRVGTWWLFEPWRLHRSSCNWREDTSPHFSPSFSPRLSFDPVYGSFSQLATWERIRRSKKGRLFAIFDLPSPRFIARRKFLSMLSDRKKLIYSRSDSRRICWFWGLKQTWKVDIQKNIGGFYSSIEVRRSETRINSALFLPLLV